MLARATLLVLFVVARASAQVPSPTVEGPITSPGGAFLPSTTFDLATVGYRQEEYFVSGTASAYVNTGLLGEDGLWTVTPGESASYKTRIVVYRPVDPRQFSGTVFVEWLNVSGGVDAAPDWILGHVEAIRSGHAWVGVSAQFVGVEGGGGLLPIVDLGLKKVSPARYGSLHHPGDSFSYDMFSQAGMAVRSTTGTLPLGELQVRRVIAVGESQSAFRLVTYIDGIHPVAHVYDGYFVHSRGAFGAPLSEAPQPDIVVPGAARIRSDIDVPVLTFETETDLTFLGYFNARQEDGDNFRLWEVAGTAHADTYTTVAGGGDVGTSPDVVNLVITNEPVPGIIVCDSAINSGPQHFVVNAALSALNRWVRRGRPPRSAPRLEVSAGPPVAIQKDANGNALGGVRTPQVDVPIATFTGEQEGRIICRLFGTTTAFDGAQLGSLYPSHPAFVTAYRRALRRSVHAGWILKPDAKVMREWAAGAAVGG
jgi:alpha/beta hydrolase family protein